MLFLLPACPVQNPICRPWVIKNLPPSAFTKSRSHFVQMLVFFAVTLPYSPLASRNRVGGNSDSNPAGCLRYGLWLESGLSARNVIALSAIPLGMFLSLFRTVLLLSMKRFKGGGVPPNIAQTVPPHGTASFKPLGLSSSVCFAWLPLLRITDVPAGPIYVVALVALSVGYPRAFNPLFHPVIPLAQKVTTPCFVFEILTLAIFLRHVARIASYVVFPLPFLSGEPQLKGAWVWDFPQGFSTPPSAADLGIFDVFFGRFFHQPALQFMAPDSRVNQALRHTTVLAGSSPPVVQLVTWLPGFPFFHWSIQIEGCHTVIPSCPSRPCAYTFSSSFTPSHGRSLCVLYPFSPPGSPLILCSFLEGRMLLRVVSSLPSVTLFVPFRPRFWAVFLPRPGDLYPSRNKK